MFDLKEAFSNGHMSEWYAIPVIVLLIVLKVFFEKKYNDSLKKK